MQVLRLCSQGRRGPGKYRLMTMDIKKAFLYADVSQDLWVRLPAEAYHLKYGSSC